MTGNIQNRKERGLLTEEEEHLIAEIESLREQLKAFRSAYEKLSKLFNELEKSQNEACKQLKTAMEALESIAEYGCCGNHDEPSCQDAKPDGIPIEEWCMPCNCEQALAKIREMEEK